MMSTIVCMYMSYGDGIDCYKLKSANGNFISSVLCTKLTTWAVFKAFS